MRQAKRSRIYEEAVTVQTGVPQAHLYLKTPHDKTPSALPRRYSICGKRSKAEYTKKPARCKPVCNRAGFLETGVPQAHLYLKISHDKTTVCSAEAPQYMRQAKRSRISVRRSITPRFTLRFGSSNPCVRAKFGRPPPHTRRPTDRK